MSDLIDRQAVMKEFSDFVRKSNNSDFAQTPTWNDAVSLVGSMPSAQPERLTDDDFETIRIHLNAYKEKLCNQQRWEEAEEYQRIIDRFMAFASARKDLRELPSAQPEVLDCGSGELVKDSQRLVEASSNDIISRQQAIEAFEPEHHTDWYTPTIIKTLEELPSAQPEITEEDVKKYCRERCFAIVDGALYEEMKARWSQPEIIRCKDCKYSSPNKVYGCRFERFDTWEDGPRMYSDDFCSRAERKEQDDG